MFQGLRLAFSDSSPGEDVAAYGVKKADPRFSRIELALESSWMSARLNSFHQPPRAQPSYVDLAALVTPGEFSELRALVVGGSRGIGEVAAKLLAAG